MLILGAAFRLPYLNKRPMHTDEAVHAIKFGNLLENNEYRYDRIEYHGPTLNYFSLIPALLSGQTKLSDLNETTLRLVPVIFGLLLIAGLLLLRDGLSRPVIIISGILIAVSPVMVFYSRYYIQEMLLTAFSFGVIGCGYRYSKTRRWYWMIFTGVFLGLMHATKETCIIPIAAMVLALGLTAGKRDEQSVTLLQPARILFLHLLAALFSGIAVSGLFYSSFLDHPTGVMDSLLTYLNYFQKASQFDLHLHPWYYYFQLLFIPNGTERLWSEGLILIFAIIGAVNIWSKNYWKSGEIKFLRFLFNYTVIMTLVYSLIPYKTPWTLLGFYQGFIILAGMGLYSTWMVIQKKWLKWVTAFIMAVLSLHLVWQSCQLNYIYDADPENPWVYGHTSNDIYKIVEDVQNAADVHPGGRSMFVEVICPDADYWPLPWYLRDFTNVGWWSEVDFTVGPAPVILAFPEVEGDVLRKCYELRVPGERDLYLPLQDSTVYLRPKVEIRGYIQKDLRDAWLRSGEDIGQ